MGQRGDLLEGEDPRSDRPDDATHWMTVYSELVSYTEGLLGTAQRRTTPGSAKAAAPSDEAQLGGRELRRRLAWYRRRLRFWTGRVSDFGAG